MNSPCNYINLYPNYPNWLLVPFRLKVSLFVPSAGWFLMPKIPSPNEAMTWNHYSSIMFYPNRWPKWKSLKVIIAEYYHTSIYSEYIITYQCQYLQFLSRNIGNHHPFQVLYLKCSYLLLVKQYAMLNMGISINSLKGTVPSIHVITISLVEDPRRSSRKSQNMSYQSCWSCCMELSQTPTLCRETFHLVYTSRCRCFTNWGQLNPVSIPKSVSYGTSTGGPLSKYHANVWSRFTSKTSGHDEHVRRIPGYHIDVGKLLGNKPWTTQAPVSKPFSNDETLVYWLCFIAAFKPSICQKSRRADKRSLQNNLLKTCAEPPLPDH